MGRFYGLDVELFLGDLEFINHHRRGWAERYVGRFYGLDLGLFLGDLEFIGHHWRDWRGWTWRHVGRFYGLDLGLFLGDLEFINHHHHHLCHDGHHHHREVRKTFEDMMREDPDKAHQAVQLLRGNASQGGSSGSSGGAGGKRNLKLFVTMMSSWQRTRQVSMDVRNKEMGMKDFFSYWRGRDRSDATIKKKWAAATSPSMFRKKRAWKTKSGKTRVWQPLQRELNNRDIISATLSGAPEEIVCGKAQAQEMMTGEAGIALHSSSKQMFGGAMSIMDGNDDFSDSSDEKDSDADKDKDVEPAKKKVKKDKKKAHKKASSSIKVDDSDSDPSSDASDSGDDPEGAPKKEAQAAPKPKRKKTPAVEIVPLDDLEDRCVKSRLLFRVQESFAAALEDKIDKWVVKTTDGDTTKGAQYVDRMKDWASHEFMLNMPWEEAGATATAAATALIEMRDGIKNWKIELDVTAKRELFAQLSKSFDEAMDALEDFHNTADRLEIKQKTQEQLAKDVRTSVQQKYYNQLVRDRVPKGFGKVLAPLVCEWDAGKTGHAPVMSMGAIPFSQQEIDAWGGVVQVSWLCEGRKDPLTEAMMRVLKSNAAKLKRISDKVEVSLSVPPAGKPKHPASFAAFTMESEFAFPEKMQAASTKKAFIMVREAGSFDRADEFFPVQNIPTLVICLEGQIAICAMSPQFVAKHREWWMVDDKKSVSDQTVVLLAANQAVLVPLGWTLAFYGLSATRNTLPEQQSKTARQKKARKEDSPYCKLAVIPCISSLDSLRDSKQVAAAYAQIIGVQDVLPQSFATEKQYLNWMESLKVVAAKAGKVDDSEADDSQAQPEQQSPSKVDPEKKGDSPSKEEQEKARNEKQM